MKPTQVLESGLNRIFVSESKTRLEGNSILVRELESVISFLRQELSNLGRRNRRNGWLIIGSLVLGGLNLVYLILRINYS